MCGVIGLVYDEDRDDLGRIAAELLETLQYRGYDSTGAVIQSDEAITLRKGVGAPSDLVHSLGIIDLGGRVFCGQVRWRPSVRSTRQTRNRTRCAARRTCTARTTAT